MSSAVTDVTSPLQHRLLIDDLQRAACPGVDEVADAIAGNPDCERGIMGIKGWAYSPKGPYSAGESPELLVRVSRGLREGPCGATWYGHVFRFVQDDDPCWISMLVRTWVNIDAESDQAVLLEYMASVIRSNRFDPGYRQNPDDIASSHESFREAISALVVKIRAFRRELRDPRISHWEEPSEGEFVPIDGPVPDSEMCLRCWDVYGFTEALCQLLGGEGDSS